MGSTSDEQWTTTEWRKNTQTPSRTPAECWHARFRQHFFYNNETETNRERAITYFRWHIDKIAVTGTAWMIVTGENWRTRRETCPNAALSSTNPTRTSLGSNRDLHADLFATNRVSHNTALNKWNVHFCHGVLQNLSLYLWSNWFIIAMIRCV